MTTLPRTTWHAVQLHHLAPVHHSGGACRRSDDPLKNALSDAEEHLQGNLALAARKFHTSTVASLAAHWLFAHPATEI